MSNIELSRHAKDMLVERNIREERVWYTIETPDSKQIGDDDNLHFTKVIEILENVFCMWLSIQVLIRIGL